MPALAVFFVIDTSACGVTVTVCEAVLLPPFVSPGVAETVAEAVVGPVAGAVMERTSVGAEPAGAIEIAVEQVATPPESAPQVQPVPEKVNEVTPAGKVLETVIVPEAASGPALETTMENDSGFPA